MWMKAARPTPNFGSAMCDHVIQAPFSELHAAGSRDFHSEHRRRDSILSPISLSPTPGETLRIKTCSGVYCVEVAETDVAYDTAAR